MRLSPSSLSVFRDCPRCFWWTQVKKIARPRGIFPSLPGGIDRAMKAYVENSVINEDPYGLYHLEGVKGAMFYPDRENVRRWQNWRTGMSCNVGEVTVTGAIDDLIVWKDGRVSPYDYKTRGSAPKPGDSEKYYGAQLDIYHLLLEQHAGLKCTGKGYLRYGWPKQVVADRITFEWETVALDTDPARAITLVERSAEVLKMDEQPDYPMTCEYCVFIAGRIPQPA